MFFQLRKFIQIDNQEKFLFLQAFILLGLMRAAILISPFKRLTRTLTHQKHIQTLTALSTQEQKLAILVGKAINRAAKFTPWESTCLAQALAAWKMLKKRNIPGAFFLGVCKDMETKAEMKAHAWSQCGETILTGAKGYEMFTIVSVFEWTR